MCAKSFIQPGALKSHIRAHMGETGQRKDPQFAPCLCEVCGKEFTNSNARSRHQKRVHETDSNEKPHKCQYCEKRFALRQTCRYHEVQKHENGEKPPPVKCEVCCKEFKTPKILRIHSKSHSGQLDYKCRYCDKLFALPQTRTNHEYCVHKQKPKKRNPKPTETE